jgi:hypothetical protein
MKEITGSSDNSFHITIVFDNIKFIHNPWVLKYKNYNINVSLKLTVKCSTMELGFWDSPCYSAQ